MLCEKRRGEEIERKVEIIEENTKALSDRTSVSTGQTNNKRGSFSSSDDYPHFDDEERKKKMKEEGWTLSLRQITTRDCLLFSSRDLCVLSNREDIFHSRLQRCAVNVPCLSISLFSLCPFLSVFRSVLFFVLNVSFRVQRESDRLSPACMISLEKDRLFTPLSSLFFVPAKSVRWTLESREWTISFLLSVSFDFAICLMLLLRIETEKSFLDKERVTVSSEYENSSNIPFRSRKEIYRQTQGRKNIRRKRIEIREGIDANFPLLW